MTQEIFSNLVVTHEQTLYAIYNEYGYWEVSDAHVRGDDFFDSQIVFDKVDKGSAKITVNALEQETFVYQIDGLPEKWLGAPIAKATLTETPLAYYLNIGMGRGIQIGGYDGVSSLLDAMDQNKERMPSYSYIGSIDGSPDAEFTSQYEIVYMKQDNRTMAFIRLPLVENGEDYAIYPITLVPLGK